MDWKTDCFRTNAPWPIPAGSKRSAGIGQMGGETKVENLEELVSAAQGVIRDKDSELPPLAEFLSYAVLESGDAQAEASGSTG